MSEPIPRADPRFIGAEALTDEDRHYQGSRFQDVRDAIFAIRTTRRGARRVSPPADFLCELAPIFDRGVVVELTLLPACHREDMWLLALLHAQCLSAHQIERRQRGVETKI